MCELCRTVSREGTPETFRRRESGMESGECLSLVSVPSTRSRFGLDALASSAMMARHVQGTWRYKSLNPMSCSDVMLSARPSIRDSNSREPGLFAACNLPRSVANAGNIGLGLPLGETINDNRDNLRFRCSRHFLLDGLQLSRLVVGPPSALHRSRHRVASHRSRPKPPIVWNGASAVFSLAS